MAAKLLMLRHGQTQWNTERRLQGHTDVPLSDEGRAQVRQWRLPQPFELARRLTSPLQRSAETARLLPGAVTPEPVDALIEMHWGAWEGRVLSDIRRQEGDQLAQAEAMGRDMRPPEGETPREVAHRLAPLMRDLAADKAPVVAVTHKGVMRALIAETMAWDMRRKPPLRLKRSDALLFTLDRNSGATSPPTIVSLLP